MQCFVSCATVGRARLGANCRQPSLHRLHCSQHGGGTRRPENVPGDWFVTSGCIDCDVCRWMAPSVFDRLNEQSAVKHQPASRAEELRALQAAASCPVGTIRTERPPSKELSLEARQSFPEPIPLGEDARNGTRVYHMGYHSHKSFGATAYLVLPGGEAWRNSAFLMDSPRFFRPLADQTERLLRTENRQLRYMVLSHVDDVADHDQWAERFGVPRIIHGDDIGYYGEDGLGGVEMKLQGTGPWALLPDRLEPLKEDAGAPVDVKLVHVPGHTPGCITAVVDRYAAFTGDHIAYSNTRKAFGAFPGVCWYDWNQVIDSIRGLAREEFVWVFPGHSRRYKFDSVPAMREGMEQAAQRMDSDAYWAMVPGGARRRRKKEVRAR
ncbi:hypothetical protein CDCA_CDCA05G1505 [Cyanidium caldarium]|uniref:Metallo-beta-lactamase domain-containing protein n=1 Tax=Cyanidium caldarium TaxID=2771 RepID=A0AAV9ITQ5_CYACA|nr:hypothetical protein CDCA_CDCA05G1505 [Cyanidium caldarium]